MIRKIEKKGEIEKEESTYASGPRPFVIVLHCKLGSGLPRCTLVTKTPCSSLQEKINIVRLRSL